MFFTNFSLPLHIIRTHCFVTLGYAFDFPNKGVTDAVKISSGMPRLTKFTVCMWMSSTNARGTLFSYAVQGRDKELLIDYHGVFTLALGKQAR